MIGQIEWVPEVAQTSSLPGSWQTLRWSAAPLLRRSPIRWRGRRQGAMARRSRGCRCFPMLLRPAAVGSVAGGCRASRACWGSVCGPRQDSPVGAAKVHMCLNQRERRFLTKPADMPKERRTECVSQTFEADADSKADFGCTMRRFVVDRQAPGSPWCCSVSAALVCWTSARVVHSTDATMVAVLPRDPVAC